MWSRSELKERAWAVLKQSYWKAFLVSLIVAFVGGQGGASYSFNQSSVENNAQGFMRPNTDILSLLPWIIGAVGIGLLLAFAFRVFVGYPLEVGGRRYFVQAAQANVDLNALGYAFEKSYYLEVIKAMLWRGVLNFLWFLLLIIPGIVKAYAYRFVPYILADNPNIGHKRAIELSVAMTAGHKFNIFVLDLSFIGWYLLGALALGVGTVFVLPYPNATDAELYLSLRNDALNNGFCTEEELLLA